MKAILQTRCGGIRVVEVSDVPFTPGSYLDVPLQTSISPEPEQEVQFLTFPKRRFMFAEHAAFLTEVGGAE